MEQLEYENVKSCFELLRSYAQFAYYRNFNNLITLTTTEFVAKGIIQLVVTKFIY